MFIRIRKDILASAKKNAETISTNSRNWHIPTGPKLGHIRALFTESIRCGKRKASSSVCQLGYEADADDNDDEHMRQSNKRRKVYYQDQIGGQVVTSPIYKSKNNHSRGKSSTTSRSETTSCSSFTGYTPVSPIPDDCPTWIKNLEVSTLVHNPFRSDGDTTDDENLNDNNKSKNKSNSSPTYSGHRTDAELNAYYLSLFSE